MKKIFVIDTDEDFLDQLRRSFKSFNIDSEYSLIEVIPDITIDDSLKIYNLLKGRIEADAHAIFVDINIVDGRDDSYGISISSMLRDSFPSTPIYNITNKTGNELEFDALSAATLENIDGVLVKSYFEKDRFSKNRFDDLIKRGLIKRSMQGKVSHPSSKFDIAVITALEKPELKSFEKLLTGKKELIKKKDYGINDTTFYYASKIERDDKDDLSIVYASDNKMGMANAASLTSRIINHFSPKLVVMIGICAGIKGKTNIGDILVGQFVWDYGSGKIEVENKVRTYRPYIEQLKLDEVTDRIVAGYVDSQLLYEIKNSYPIANNINAPRLILGPFASGASVIASSQDVDEIAKQHPKLIGFDMETYAVFRAVESFKTKPKVISMKSVSDFGDDEKGNLLKEQHQAHAAYTSAKFFIDFIKLEFENIFE
jgi:nucleoside phosphorylase